MMKVREITVKVGFGHISAKLWGENTPSAQKFIALHGWLDNAGSFDPLMEQFTHPGTWCKSVFPCDQGKKNVLKKPQPFIHTQLNILRKNSQNLEKSTYPKSPYLIPVTIFRLKAQCSSGSPLWLWFEPRFSLFRAQCPTIDLYHSPTILLECIILRVGALFWGSVYYFEGRCVILRVGVLFWRSVCYFEGRCIILRVGVLFWGSVYYFEGRCIILKVGVLFWGSVY